MLGAMVLATSTRDYRVIARLALTNIVIKASRGLVSSIETRFNSKIGGSGSGRHGGATMTLLARPSTQAVRAIRGELGGDDLRALRLALQLLISIVNSCSHSLLQSPTRNKPTFLKIRP
jgi:hypothetical protein